MTPSFSSANPSRSLLFIPLLVGLMLQIIVSTQAAPIPSDSVSSSQHSFQSAKNIQRTSSSNAAQKAAQLSKQSTTEANKFNVANTTVSQSELTPWYEKHENTRPRPSVEVLKNATVISHGHVLPNATVFASNFTIIANNGTIISNGTEFSNTTSSNNQTSFPTANAISSTSNQTANAFEGVKLIDDAIVKPKSTVKKNKKKKNKSTKSKNNKTTSHKEAVLAVSNSALADCSSGFLDGESVPPLLISSPSAITQIPSPSITTTKSTTTTTSKTQITSSTPTSKPPSTNQTSCFPALGFQMPSSVPKSLDGWWCDPRTEYAFLGFSYEISACQSQSQLIKEFKDARNTFNARYVRLYGACDEPNYYNKVVEAAWQAGIGVHALIWFGFDGGDQWKTRRDSLFTQLHSNPKAKFVTRGVQFGSEPLFDWVLSGTDLAKQVTLAKSKLANLKINVTISDMAYGYQAQESSGSQNVLNAIDFIDAHMLPYFAQDASTGSQAWHNNANDMNYFLSKAPNKKIYWSQNGWPSTHDCNAGVCPNSRLAVSSVKSQQAYYNLLDSKCTTIKAYPQGGVGWFAHIYSDNQEPGYGIYDYNMKLKFPFKPKTSC